MVIAHNGHDGKWLHAILLRVKVRRLVDDDIWVNIGVQIADAKRSNGIFERCCAITAGVIRAIASGGISAIAINVHVVIVSGPSFQKDGIGDISAEYGAGRRLSRQCFLTSSGLMKEYVYVNFAF